MVKVELLLDRLVKSQSLVLLIKEKGMFDKNLLVFSVGKNLGFSSPVSVVQRPCLITFKHHSI